jgi:type II secretory pathway pseudopilin PulG
MHRQHTPTFGRLAAGGFSLMELLVVISIIIVLVGLMVYVGIERKGSEVMTHKTMEVMQAALAEYTAITNGLVVDHRSEAWDGKGQTPTAPDGVYTNDEFKMNNINQEFYAVGYSAGSATDGWLAVTDMSTIERFVWKTIQYPSIKKIYDGLGSDIFLDADGDGMMEVVDAWGRPLRYAVRLNYNDPSTYDDFNTRTDVDGSSKNTAYTYYDANDVDSKMPVSAQPYFASSGRDGKWGDAKSSDTDLQDFAKDNLTTLKLD